MPQSRRVLCLCDGDFYGQRRYVFGLSICPILVNGISQECLEGISSMKWIDFGGQRSRSLRPYIHSVLMNATSQERLEDILITPIRNSRMSSECRIWWPKVKGHRGLTIHVYGHNPRIHVLIMTKFHTNI